MAADGPRTEILRRHGAAETEVCELLAYTRNTFSIPDFTPAYPLPDEPFVAAWEQYELQARVEGAAATLREHLIQLRFAIAAETGESEAYRSAVRKGVIPPAGAHEGVRFKNPEGLFIYLHATPAGRIPVVVAEAREDFIALVRALTCRNRPDPIPDSMGAVIVGGYNNWSRVRALREAWRAADARRDDAAWQYEFARLAQCKELYQDRFILLSTGPYSGVPAMDVGMEPGAWLRTSLRLRLEHECAHYFTRRLFNRMSNSLHDEIVADFVGMVAATGRFRADWLLRFMGVDTAHGVRAEGRLNNYRGNPRLSDAAFAVLASLLVRIAVTLETWHVEVPDWDSLESRAQAIPTLCRFSLEELAADDAVGRLRALHRMPIAQTNHTS